MYFFRCYNAFIINCMFEQKTIEKIKGETKMQHYYKTVTAKIMVAVMILLLLTPAYTYAENKKPENLVTDYETVLEIPLADNTEDLAVSFEIKDKTKEDIEKLISENKIKLSLVRDGEKDYADKELFPNQFAGGTFDQWKTQAGTDMFTGIEYAVEEKEGKLYLNITFDSSCYFYSGGEVDLSVPHSNGGDYLDICGYFDISAGTSDESGEFEIGKAAVKVVPYIGFHTMEEIYSEIKQIVAEGKANGLYAEEFSMGTSTGGRNMPYMIVAKDASAVSQWIDFTELAETDPAKALEMIESGNFDNIKVPVMYSNVHANEVAAADGIMDFAKKLVKNDTVPYDKFTGFTEAGQAQLQSEMAQNQTAIPDLVKDTATYLGYIQDGNGKSGPVDIEKYYTVENDEVNVSELLEDVFFILVPEENVDGRTYITRAADNGYDLNRDNSFQTTAETANMQKLIGTYNPVSFVELHGRVTDFQCEPCSPPHEPNFEYDLLSENLMGGGEAFGIAASANNDGYNSYVIPQRDYLKNTGSGTYWEYPWDDMSTSYTPQFAMLQGTVAYTVELPAYSSDTVLAASYGILGQADYIADVKLDYLTAQTKIFQRGVTNYNSDGFDEVGQWLCDQYDVEGAEAELFRPEFDGEGENGNFYPECYIIPMDGKNQVNIASAASMLELLARNDVKINIADKPFTYNKVEYPKGTAIISMYQAKRSVANGLLYDGTLIQSWSELYSEGITTFNEARGFDMETVADVKAYKEIKEAMGSALGYEATVEYTGGLGSVFEGTENADVIIDNTSEESTAAVNALLKGGKIVAMITEGENKGDYICSYQDYMTIKDQYLVEAEGVYGDKIKAQVITKSPLVYLTGAPGTKNSGYYDSPRISSSNWNYDRVAMELMNFNITADAEVADVIAGASTVDSNAFSAIQSGKPYIGYGANTKGMTALFGDSFARTGVSGAMDCLGHVEYPEKTLVNSNYVSENDDIFYGYGLGYFSNVPEGAKVIVKMNKDKAPSEGFIPEGDGYNNFINGSVQGFEYAGKDAAGNNIDVCLFANSLTHKAHQRDEYGFISNFIFSKALGDEYAGMEEPEDGKTPDKEDADAQAGGADKNDSQDKDKTAGSDKNAKGNKGSGIKTGDENQMMMLLVIIAGAAVMMLFASAANKKFNK